MGIDVYRRDKGKKNNANSASSSAFTSKDASAINSENESGDDHLNEVLSMLDVSSKMRKMNVNNNFTESDFIGRNLYVSGFKGEIKNDKELSNLFNRFGPLNSVKCIVEKNEFGDITKNFGYVCFKKDENAKVALQTMNRFKFQSGIMITVKPYKPKHQRISNSTSFENICVKNTLDIATSSKALKTTATHVDKKDDNGHMKDNEVIEDSMPLGSTSSNSDTVQKQSSFPGKPFMSGLSVDNNESYSESVNPEFNISREKKDHDNLFESSISNGSDELYNFGDYRKINRKSSENKNENRKTTVFNNAYGNQGVAQVNQSHLAPERINVEQEKIEKLKYDYTCCLS
ncbi:hypothetical protein B4U80_13399 [Leptotrombidium deliense]|uniref:RRM domain-containing protein n=1 Tax=Leptotrombidium deliense TaxID=299467 RepID=A0A443S769_9ACAR|nr:hypothetical protein B4U80_13399 [Leptotrombidium deliense]